MSPRLPSPAPANPLPSASVRQAEATIDQIIVTLHFMEGGGISGQGRGAARKS